MKTILITGGTGFAGSHLVEALLKFEPDTNIHVTSFSGTPGLVSDLLPSDNTHQLDLTDAEATKQTFSQIKPTQVYHLASVARVGKSFDEAEFILHNNTSLHLSLLEAVRDVVPEAKVLAVSSADIYDHQTEPLSENSSIKPSNPYGISKYTQELLTRSYAEAFGLQIVTVRPFNHIGERQTNDFVIPAFAHQIAKIEAGLQEKLKVGNLEAVRDFTDVKDMVKAYILLMDTGQAGQVYNAGSGRGVKIADMLSHLTRLSLTDIQVESDPSRMRPVDVPYIVADPSKLQSLGWRASSDLTHTLERVLEYWRSNL